MTDTMLATAMKDNYQTAYVTGDIEAAREALTEMFGVQEYDSLEARLDVIDDDKAKIGEIGLKLSFALDRSIELIEPTDDPIGAFKVDPSGPLLQFHHLGTIVDDVDQTVGEAQDRGLKVVRMAIPGLMEVAFVDLRSAGGHYLELVPRMAVG